MRVEVPSDAAEKHPDCPAVEGPISDTGKRANRAVFPTVDGRVRGARRYRDVLDALIVENDCQTESDLSLARRVAGLVVWCEAEEARASAGERVDGLALVTAANTMRRLISSLAASARSRRRMQKATA